MFSSGREILPKIRKLFQHHSTLCAECFIRNSMRYSCPCSSIWRKVNGQFSMEIGLAHGPNMYIAMCNPHHMSTTIVPSSGGRKY